jgi:signal transduction histidine kinase
MDRLLSLQAPLRAATRALEARADDERLAMLIIAAMIVVAIVVLVLASPLTSPLRRDRRAADALDDDGIPRDSIASEPRRGARRN